MGTAQLTGSSFTRRLLFFLSLLLFASLTARGEILPVKTYTTADGLLRDSAFCIVQDSRGFIWFCTSDGLSRFDGYSFTNYTTDDGLPHRVVNAFVEARNGTYWVGTNNGLARFNPRGGRAVSAPSTLGSEPSPMFLSHNPASSEAGNVVEALLEDTQGRLWIGTSDGLYWLEERNGRFEFHRVDLPKVQPKFESVVLAITEDHAGNLWVGTDGQGLYRVLKDGRIEHYTDKNGLPLVYVKSLLVADDGRIWVGSGGVCQLVANPDPGRHVVSHCYTKRDGLASDWIHKIYQTSDGKLWLNTTNGLAAFEPKAAREAPIRIYKAPEGLCDAESQATLEDRDGNIWVSTTCGIKKIAARGFVRFTQTDGLAPLGVNAIFTSHAGELFVITKRGVETTNRRSRHVHTINLLVRDKFISVTPSLPPGISTGWGGGQIVVQDKSGDWWLPGNQSAVYRFSQVQRLDQLSTRKPEPIDIPDKEVFRIYEDSRGDMWISTMYDGHLLKWERATGTMRDYRDEIGGSGVPSCFAEDAAGNVWVGYDFGQSRLARYQNGRLTVLSNDQIKASGGLVSLYFDHLGRLWLATKTNGVGLIENPNADQLTVAWYNRRSGLATDGTLALIEDKFGHMYVAHGRGVDRINPKTGQIKHYTTADGLPQGAIHFATRDIHDDLWFSSSVGGVARLRPVLENPRQSPRILLTGLRIAGAKQAVSDLGESAFPELTLNSSQNQVSVDFVGLGASLGEELKYRYKLEGEWSEPTSQRTVDFANLAPGTYRLQVKVLAADGSESTTHATFTFTILRPVWQRWWFLLIVASVLTLILIALYRYRVGRLLELERIRTRIASDLHDDIGASLSRIAIMSEVVKRQVAGSNGESGRLLSDIADSARELTGSMRDIVWAIDPRRDDLGSVVSRIRQFASNVFEGKAIRWEFHTPANLDKINLGPDERRHVLLFFKEAINNIARHADSTNVRLTIDVVQGILSGEVRDDGRGFELQQSGEPITGFDGHGLESMRRRVRQLGGEFTIDSAPGEGTHLRITIPVRKP